MRTLRGACNLVNSSVPGCLPSLGRFHYSPSFVPRASEKLPSCPSLERLRSCLQRGHQFGSDKTLVKILCRSGHPYVREPFSTPPSSRLAATPDVSPSVAVLRRTRAPLSAGGGGGPRLDSGLLSDHKRFLSISPLRSSVFLFTFGRSAGYVARPADDVGRDSKHMARRLPGIYCFSVSGIISPRRIKPGMWCWK